MSIWRVNRTYRNIQRLQTMLNILIKHGFGQLVRKIGLHRILPLGKKASTFAPEDSYSFFSVTLPERFRMVLEDMGPTFIKFGQVLSTRPDMLPESFIHELKKLREDVKPVSTNLIRNQIEEALEQNIDDVFSFFDDVPIATASVAQVHQATIIGGEEVVVKVLRPGIERVIRNDLDILMMVAKLIEKHIPELTQFDPVGLVQEFERSIMKEMDFTVEAANTSRFRKNFETDESVVIPKVFWELSRKNILVLEKISGINMDSLDEIMEMGLNPKQLARKGMKIFLKSILEFGLFHADPHPGNIIVCENGKIGLMDFGMVGCLDLEARENLSRFVLYLINREYSKLFDPLRNLGFVFNDEVVPSMKKELMELIDIYYGLPLGNISISNVLTNLIETVIRYGVKVPSDFLMLSRSMVLAEGVGRQLDPNIDIMEIGRPMVIEIIKKQSSPHRIAKESILFLSEVQHSIKKIPETTNMFVRKLLNGKLRLEFFHLNIEPLNKEIERLGNRIAFGLVTASLILGSSLIILSNKGPFLWGFPAFGLIGFSLAAVIGMWLIISILRSGRF